MKQLKENKNSILSDILPLIVFLLCSLIVSITCRAQVSNYNTEVVDVTDGWTTPDGQVVSLDDLPEGDITITHDLTDIYHYKKRLCFKSTHTTFRAEINGETTYVYEPVQKRLIGASYGMYVHMIPIRDDAPSITLKLHPVYDGSAMLQFAVIEDAAQFQSDMYHRGLPSFSLCVVIALYGLLMLIIGFTLLISSGENNINFVSLGAFAFIVGIWSMNETMILQMYTQHPEVVRFIHYTCLIFISYPPISFIASATNQRDSKFLPVLRIITYANFVATILLSLLGVCDIRTMLTYYHLSVIFSIFVAVYLMVRSKVKKTTDPKLLRTIVLSITPAIIGVIMDIIRFRFFSEIHYDASLFTKIGVMAFTIIMGVHLIHELSNLAVEQGHAKIMQKMAYTDALTNLPNRAAFQNKEEEVIQNHSECVIVQLDINLLKTVNDVYGHAAGDYHIISAAKIIRNSFLDIGTSYRTGGDEFIVVAENVNTGDVENAITRMEERIEEYNSFETPPVDLEIAYGYAQHDPKVESLESTEMKADRLMYEKKKRMKEERKLREEEEKNQSDTPRILDYIEDEDEYEEEDF